MDDKNTERLVKLLRLTESDQDGEALNALRAAQRLLKVHGKSLVDFVNFAVQQKNKAPAPRPSSSPTPPPAPSPQQSPFASVWGGLGDMHEGLGVGLYGMSPHAYAGMAQNAQQWVPSQQEILRAAMAQQNAYTPPHAEQVEAMRERERKKRKGRFWNQPD